MEVGHGNRNIVLPFSSRSFTVDDEHVFEVSQKFKTSQLEDYHEEGELLIGVKNT